MPQLSNLKKDELVKLFMHFFPGTKKTNVKRMKKEKLIEKIDDHLRSTSADDMIK